MAILQNPQRAIDLRVAIQSTVCRSNRLSVAKLCSSFDRPLVKSLFGMLGKKGLAHLFFVIVQAQPVAVYFVVANNNAGRVQCLGRPCRPWRPL